MEVDHTDGIMRCVRGGMVGCGTQPLLENADSTAPSIPIGDNPAPVVPLFDLIRLLVGAGATEEFRTVEQTFGGPIKGY